MFKLQPDPTFISQVKISVPGKTEPAIIKVTFKYMSAPDLKAYFEGLKGKTNAEGLSEIIVDWDGVDAKFSAESLQTLLDNYSPSAGELYDAYRRDLIDSRQKN